MSRSWAVKDGGAIREEDGSVKVIEGFDKAQQDVMHSLMHPYDSSTDYGNELIAAGASVNYGALAGLVQRDLSACISRLRRTQRKLDPTQVPDNERITGINRLVIRASSSGTSVAYYLHVGVVDRSAKDIATRFNVTTSHLSGYPDA